MIFRLTEKVEKSNMEETNQMNKHTQKSKVTDFKKESS